MANVVDHLFLYVALLYFSILHSLFALVIICNCISFFLLFAYLLPIYICGIIGIASHLRQVWACNTSTKGERICVDLCTNLSKLQR